MFWRRMGPEEARVRLLLLRKGCGRRWGPSGPPRQEESAPGKGPKGVPGVLEHLRRLEAEGRYPEAVLRPALAREELRIRYAEGEIARPRRPTGRPWPSS